MTRESVGDEQRQRGRQEQLAAQGLLTTVSLGVYRSSYSDFHGAELRNPRAAPGCAPHLTGNHNLRQITSGYSGASILRSVSLSWAIARLSVQAMREVVLL